MSTSDRPPRRQIEALRACLLYPQGLRHEAYPSAMPVLQKLGFVISRPAKGPGRKIPAWFLTEEGRKLLMEIEGRKAVKGLGTGEPEE